MKKIISLLVIFVLISCSNSDEGSNPSDTGQLSFNGTDYSFDHIYIKKRDFDEYPYFQVFLTKGTLSSTGENSYSYSNNFTRMVGFIIQSGAETLGSGTRNFPLFTYTAGENFILFRDSYSIDSGNALTYDTIFSETDNITEQSRVVITKINDNEYSFDFNVITSAGTLTGYYRGAATIFN